MADLIKRKLAVSYRVIDTKRTKSTGGETDDEDFEMKDAGQEKEEHDKQVEESKAEKFIIDAESEQNELLVTSDGKTDDKMTEESAEENFDQQDSKEIKAEKEHVGFIITESDDESMTEEELERYYNQLSESEGFDVEDFSHHEEFGMICPLPLNEFVSKRYSKHATLAIQQYNNENNSSFEFKEVKQVNQQGLGLYNTFYITFEASDLNAADAESATETFQSRLVDGPSRPGKLDKFELTVEFCRQKPTPNNGSAEGSGSSTVAESSNLISPQY